MEEDKIWHELKIKEQVDMTDKMRAEIGILKVRLNYVENQFNEMMNRITKIVERMK